MPTGATVPTGFTGATGPAAPDPAPYGPPLAPPAPPQAHTARRRPAIAAGRRRRYGPGPKAGQPLKTRAGEGE